MAEAENPQADVVWGLAASSLLVANDRGLIQGYAPKGLSNVKPALGILQKNLHGLELILGYLLFVLIKLRLKKTGYQYLNLGQI